MFICAAITLLFIGMTFYDAPTMSESGTRLEPITRILNTQLEMNAMGMPGAKKYTSSTGKYESGQVFVRKGDRVRTWGVFTNDSNSDIGIKINIKTSFPSRTIQGNIRDLNSQQNDIENLLNEFSPGNYSATAIVRANSTMAMTLMVRVEDITQFTPYEFQWNIKCLEENCVPLEQSFSFQPFSEDNYDQVITYLEDRRAWKNTGEYDKITLDNEQIVVHSHSSCINANGNVSVEIYSPLLGNFELRQNDIVLGAATITKNKGYQATLYFKPAEARSVDGKYTLTIHHDKYSLEKNITLRGIC